MHQVDIGSDLILSRTSRAVGLSPQQSDAAGKSQRDPTAHCPGACLSPSQSDAAGKREYFPGGVAIRATRALAYHPVSLTLPGKGNISQGGWPFALPGRLPITTAV